MVVLQEEEPFNPDYVEVDRILDVSHSVDKDNGEVGGTNLVRTLVDIRLRLFLEDQVYTDSIFPFRMSSTTW